MNILKMQASPDDGAAVGGVADEGDSKPSVVEENDFETLFDDQVDSADESGDGEKLPPGDVEFGPPEPADEPTSASPPPSEPQAEGGTPPAPAAEPTPPVPAPAEPPAAHQQPVPEPVAQQAPEPTPAPVPDLEVLRGQAQQELTAKYALSKEDADLLISEPEAVIPKLLSQVYLDVYDNVMRSMQVFLPQMVQQVNQASTVQQQGEQEFYTAWPRLAEHRVAVSRIGHMYRQMNPQATKEQFIRDVGLHASITLQLPVESPLMQAPTAQPTPPATPSAPPYVPPRGGPSIPQNPRNRRPPNQFEELTENWDDE